MGELLLADGILSGASERLAAFAVKCLAVAGGFLVGYFLGGVIAWALDRWVFAHKAPDPLKKAVSIVCGIALAVLVALIVFGEGGSGLFGGGGAGDGKGSPTDDKGKSAPEPKEPIPSPKVVEPPKTPNAKPTPGDMHVTILAGDAVLDGRFYLIDGDPTPKTLEELKETVATRRKESKHEVTLVFRFKKEVLSSTHPEMQRLTAWLKEAKLLNRFE
jgi:hypothetical protein